METSSEIALPNVVEIEKSILSLMLQSSEDWNCTGKILGSGIDSDYFYNPAHSKLFDIIAKNYRNGSYCDLVDLTQDLKNKGEMAELGGAAGIAEIYTYSPSSAYLTHHIEKLRTYKSKRDAIKAADSIEKLALDHDKDTESINNAFRMAQEALAGNIGLTDSLKTSEEACGLFMDKFEHMVRSGELQGQLTGINSIDEVTGGMRSHDLWVIAGKPSDGKSVLMLQMANNLLKQGKKVLVFSLEMGRDEVISRAISYTGVIHGDYLTKPSCIDKGTLLKMRGAIDKIKNYQLKINDKGGQSMDTIEAQCLQQRDAEGVDLVVIDYIQIVTFDSKNMSKTEGIEEVSGRMKQLAKKMECPVLTGSQLNDDGRLKAARKIGEDANVVLKITDKGLAVDKNRNGRRGDCLNLRHIEGMNKFEPINNQ